MNILILTRYDTLGASSRLRMLQYLPWLEKADFNYKHSPFIKNNLLEAVYEKKRYPLFSLIFAYWQRIYILTQRHQFDLIWIEKEALPWLPVWFEKRLLTKIPCILDYDDATFHRYDQHSVFFVRKIFSQRIDKIMANAVMVIAGNTYLAQRASAAGAKKVEIIPTAIDLERYKLPAASQQCPTTLRIVWIGSPHTLKYLKQLQKPLATLSQQFKFKLRIINNSSLDLPGVDVEFVAWEEATEVASLQACDIGIMPLTDSVWERGKCGYKLIQYMACNLPVVASPIGVNAYIVRDGDNGYLATTDNDWLVALGKLLDSPEHRKQMGEAGRRRVEAEFRIQETAPKIINLLQLAKR